MQPLARVTAGSVAGRFSRFREGVGDYLAVLDPKHYDGSGVR